MTFPITQALVAGFQADSATVNGSNQLTAWPDESGSNNHIPTIGSVPPVKISGPNGAGAIQFANDLNCYADRVHDTHPLNNLPAGTQTRTIFLLANYIANSTGNGGFEYGNAANGESFGLMSNQSANPDHLGVKLYGSGYDLVTTYDIGGTGWTFLAAKLWDDAGVYKIDLFINNTKYTTITRDSSTSNAVNTVLNRLTFGAEPGSPRRGVGLDVAASGVYSTDLSDAKIKILNQYFTAKYVATTPALMEVRVNGTTITMTFNQAVQVGAGGNAGFAFTMTGGAVTATYASGTGTTSLVYTASRTIAEDETGTVTYTQPGDGIESTGGTDVATTTAFQVNNVTSDTPANVGWRSGLLYADDAQSDLVDDVDDVSVAVYQNILAGTHVTTLNNQSVADGELVIDNDALGVVTDLRDFYMESQSGGWNLTRRQRALIDLNGSP